VHDAAAPAGRHLTGPGLATHPTGTLLERALRYLDRGPADSLTLARDVLGLSTAPRVVAERLAVALLGPDPRVNRDHQGRWRLALTPAVSTTLDDAVFAVVDVETTGSRPLAGDRITEIAVVVVGPRGRTETVCDLLVNPGRPIPPAVTRVTRITNEMVLDRPVFPEIVDHVLTALAGRIFVAHNAQFDWRFVESEIRRARDLRLDGPRVCTVRLARRLVPEVKHRGLDSLSRYFGVEIEQRHRAGPDALGTARILVRLLERAVEQGAITLDDLSRVGRQAVARRRRRQATPTQVLEDPCD
jgi:DNA polymerase-3 subunit epsilon